MRKFGGYLRQHHIALLALFISLGGTSYAAVKLPRNSVGGTQIRSGAVTTKKVKDGSLLAGDFKAGQLPAGQNGAAGAPGARGATGASGPAGPAGPAPPPPRGDRGASGPAAPAAPAGADGKDGKDGAPGPTGSIQSAPAGGSLAGTYPNPTIAAGAVGSAQLATDSVGSSKLQDGAVGLFELAGDSVNTGRVVNNSLEGADINESTLGTVPNASVASNASFATNAGALGGVAPTGFASIGRSSAVDSTCSDDQGVGQACGAVTVTLPRSSRLLVMATGTALAFSLNDTIGPDAGTDATDIVEGTCRLQAGGNNVGPAQEFLMDTFQGRDVFTITGVTGSAFPAGNVTLQAVCREVDGDIEFNSLQVSAVALSAD